MNNVTEVTAAIIVALLSLIGNCLTSWLAHLKSTALVTYRLEQLEKKVDQHNHLVERMVAVEERSKSNTHRLDELEKV